MLVGGEIEKGEFLFFVVVVGEQQKTSTYSLSSFQVNSYSEFLEMPPLFDGEGVAPRNPSPGKLRNGGSDGGGGNHNMCTNIINRNIIINHNLVNNSVTTTNNLNGGESPSTTNNNHNHNASSPFLSASKKGELDDDWPELSEGESDSNSRFVFVLFLFCFGFVFGFCFWFVLVE